MNYIDIFKKSFLEGFASGNITIKTILLCMCITLLLSAYIFVIYRCLNRNSFYNKNFNLSLPAIAIITAAIILTIQSNIVISLGMVGALSIVRFRTAIKDPIDLVFLFWSISIGIICGAGFAIIAVIASVVITLGLLFGSWLPIAKASQILLINSSSLENEQAIMQVVAKYCVLHKVKARNVTSNHVDMAIEVRVKEEEKLVKEIMHIENMDSASLIAHDGEATF